LPQYQDNDTSDLFNSSPPSSTITFPSVSTLTYTSTTGSSTSGGSGSDDADDEDLKVLICPLSKKMMKDPVIAMDNNNYEREAIEEYFKELENGRYYYY